MKVNQTVSIGNPVQEIPIIPNAITAFENDYGIIPDRLSCRNVTLDSSAVKSLIAPNQWVDYPAISALLGLIDTESTGNFDATFLALLCRANTTRLLSQFLTFFDISKVLLD